jgi:polysaccharide deacetylase family protein (PEP-CTERM system associated)
VDISQKYMLLTFDIEDWFQVENLRPWIPFSSWDNKELRVETNVHTILDLLDSVNLGSQGARRKAQGVFPLRSRALTHSRTHESPKATFFILGWIAERLPHLVREIQARGHEVSSHGFDHSLCSQCSPEGLQRDLMDSRKLLEDIIGAPVYGYRAPSFSINNNVLEILQKCEYRYDSSYNSFGGNSRYGKLILNSNGNDSIAHSITDGFYELPISNLPFTGGVLPLGGGGYFRLIPFKLFKKGVRAILKKQEAYIFYLHPWEFDPDQPRVAAASRLSRFRHYHNLKKTEERLFGLIKDFMECQFVTCSQYINLR